MDESKATALIAFAEQVGKAGEQTVRVIDALLARVDRELAEIRDGLIDLDHEKVSRREYEALHTRVAALESRL